MSLPLAVLGFGRALMQARFTETARITAPTASAVDPVTLATTAPPGATLYDGPAEVTYRSDGSTGTEVVASRPATVQTPRLRLPVGALLPENARVEVTASTSDPSLVGRVYTVRGAPDSGLVTAHRYQLVEVRP